MQATAPSPFRARLRWVFLGPDGIRAGWSILIFMAMIVLVSAIIGFAVRKIFHIDPKTLKLKEIVPWMLLAQEGLSCALIYGATKVMSRIEGRSVWSYGLVSDRIASKFAIGWLGGFVCLSALVALLGAGGFLVFDGTGLHGIAVLSYGLVWFAGFAAVGLLEENAFRGYIQYTLTRGMGFWPAAGQRVLDVAAEGIFLQQADCGDIQYTLTRGMGFWPAALVTSLLFGATHLSNHGETVIGIAEVVVAGLVLCMLLRVTGSLWVGIGFHAAWDWAQSYFYGTPDSGLLVRGHYLISHAAGNAQFSGGATGPEGSALSPPVMIGGLLALVWLCRRPALRFGMREAIPAE